MRTTCVVRVWVARTAVCVALAALVSCSRAPTEFSPVFHVVNVRIDETSKAEGDGTCRLFNTAVTIATSDPLFRDRTGSTKVLVRDTAPHDRDEGGSWVAYDCELLPTSSDAKLYSWFEANRPQDIVDKKTYTAACRIALYKYCYDQSAGGDYDKHHPVQRERPVYEFKLLSWRVDSTGGSLVQ